MSRVFLLPGRRYWVRLPDWQEPRNLYLSQVTVDGMARFLTVMGARDILAEVPARLWEDCLTIERQRLFPALNPQSHDPLPYSHALSDMQYHFGFHPLAYPGQIVAQQMARGGPAAVLLNSLATGVRPNLSPIDVFHTLASAVWMNQHDQRSFFYSERAAMQFARMFGDEADLPITARDFADQVPLWFIDRAGEPPHPAAKYLIDAGWHFQFIR